MGLNHTHHTTPPGYFRPLLDSRQARNLKFGTDTHKTNQAWEQNSFSSHPTKLPIFFHRCGHENSFVQKLVGPKGYYNFDCVGPDTIEIKVM